jgi:DNA-binding transcriptional LysR family regulator
VAEPSFTLVQLRYFAAAAEHGSMTKASRELMVSQSAISTAVAQLEKELGVQLLLRHHARGLALTEAGRNFYQELLGFLEHSGELAESARRAGATVVGDLAVGCFTTLAPFRQPGLLAAFREQHPRVRVSVLEGEHARLKRALRTAECELALMYGYDLEEDIDRAVVDTAPPYVLVSSTHRLAARDPAEVELRELAGEPMVLLALPHSSAYLESVLRGAGVEPVIRHRTAGYETVRAMVAHGHGFALLNQRPSHEMTYDGSRVVSLALRDELEPLSVVLAWMRGARLTRRAQAFSAACRSRYARPAPESGS